MHLLSSPADEPPDTRNVPYQCASSRWRPERYRHSKMDGMSDSRLMPRVFDLSRNEAEAALRAAGLDFDVVLAQSTAVPGGDLIDVSPRPGTPVDEGTRVVLTVSAGRPIGGACDSA